MEAKHKTKAREKQAVAEHESSSDSELSDFEEVKPKLATVQESKKTYYTPDDKSSRLVIVLDNACLETA